MGAAIFIIVVIIIIVLIANSSNPTPNIKANPTEQQQREKKQREQEEQRRAAVERQQQAERERIAEQQRLQLERERVADQQRQDSLRREQEFDRQQELEQQRQRTLCETNTVYSADLQRIFNHNPTNFSFSTIRSLSNNQGNDVFRQLEQGVAKLTTQQQLSQYVFSYGNMHQEKLKQAFQTIFLLNHLQLHGQTFEIVDYGCGQGLGTVCLIDFLKSRNVQNWTISKVRLIEPSDLALKRAALNVRFSLRSANQAENTLAIRKELDDLNNLDLGTNNSAIKLHIFSNILDVEDFSIEQLYQKITATQQGSNFFICVSPNIIDSRNERLDLFQYYFEQRGGVTPISFRSHDIPNPSNPERPWRRYERVFKIQLGNQTLRTNNQVNSRIEPTEFADDLPF